MTTSHCIRFALIAWLTLTLSAQNAPQQTVLPIGSAEISEVKGSVVLHASDGSLLNAQRGVTLDAGSSIETAKGSLLLELEDGSQVLVKAHSKVVLKAPNEGTGDSLELLIGKLLAKVRKRLGSNPSFRMGTPTATITVRGTRFSVEVNKHGTIVEVFEGLVDVAGLTEGSPHVLIRPGFYTGIQNDRAPDQPREFNPSGDGSEDGPRDDGSRNPEGGREREDQPKNQQRQERSNQGSPEGKSD